MLSEGLKIIPFYDRIELVTAAINTVRDALIEGIVLVTVVFFLFLGHVRSAIVVTVSLLVTPLMTFLVMQRVGLSANLMTLGGLAIGIGEIAGHVEWPESGAFGRPLVGDGREDGRGVVGVGDQ